MFYKSRTCFKEKKVASGVNTNECTHPTEVLKDEHFLEAEHRVFKPAAGGSKDKEGNS